MKEEKKRARLQAKLAAALGLEVPTGAVSVSNERPGAAGMEAEATLNYIRVKVKGFVEKECARCEHTFASSSDWVRYCGDPCRKADAWDQGIKWDPAKPPNSRWANLYAGNYAPLEHQVVGPQALIVAKQVLDRPVEEVTIEEVVIEDHDSECGEACSEMHTFEKGCYFYIEETLTDVI